MTPKWPLTLQGQMYPIHICITFVLESQISLCFTVWPAVLSYRPFWDKCTEWPPNYLEHYKVKVTPHICVTSMPKCQISVCFALKPAIFKIMAHFISGQFTIDNNVKWQKKNQKNAKNSKFQIRNSFNNLVETLPGSIYHIHDLWGANLVYTFRGAVIWNFSFHMVWC